MIYYFNCFLVYSLVGNLIELLFSFVVRGKFEKRKTMRLLPFCTVYGIGAVFMIIFLNGLKTAPLLIFILGMFIGTGVEYIYAAAAEYFLNVTFWEYEGKTSFKGRVDLFFSACWGAVSLFFIYYAHPAFTPLIRRIPLYISGTFFILFCFDLILTVRMLKRVGRFGHPLKECPVVKKAKGKKE